VLFKGQYWLILSAILILTTGLASAWERPFFFIVMADPQIEWNAEQNGVFYNSEELFARAVEEANLLQPDFVVMCGDLIQSAGSNNQFDTFKSLADGLQVPYLTVPGNHDVGLPPTSENHDWYVERSGRPLWYTHEFNNSLFIFLESNVLKDPGSLSGKDDEQMEWLQGALQAAELKNYLYKMVFLHHPMCFTAVDEPEEYFNMPVVRRQAMIQLYHDHGVTASFSGHYHRNAYVKDNDLELITYSSTGMQLGEPDGPGFGIVKMSAGGMEQQFYRYQDLPGEVESDNPGFTLTYPNGGEVMQADSTVTVTWDSESMARSVKLEYTIDDQNWTVISDSTPNNGSYDWTLPDATSETVKVRVSSLLNSYINDLSDGPNSIGDISAGIFGNTESGFLQGRTGTAVLLLVPDKGLFIRRGHKGDTSGMPELFTLKGSRVKNIYSR
jgi:3',5'-cyclic AMP phosphodiesterase CpdA